MGGIAAFFDIDGTLVKPPSLEWRLALRLAVRGELNCRAGARWAGRNIGWALNQLRERASRDSISDRNKAWVEGLSRSSVEKSSKAVAEAAPLHCAMARKIVEHTQSGDRIFFVSGTLAPLARALATRFASACQIEVFATELAVIGGKFTGAVSGEPVCGKKKAAVVRKIALQHDLDLSRSFAYANSGNDRWFLETVGRPTAVFPDRALAEISRKHRWPVISAKEAQPGDPFLAVRGTLSSSTTLEL